VSNLKNGKINGDKFRFVLSSGRVGTTSLREYLKANVSNLDVAFEPKSSRRAFMLWNLEQFLKFGHDLSESYVMKQRNKNFHRIQQGHTRIEINPFLTPFCKVVSENVSNMHVVHIVRHPYTWINSIMNFRALGWHKYFIDLVPFTRIRHPLVKNNWSNLTEAERFAWGWRLHNEQIRDSMNNYAEYKLIKYEDLSLGDKETKIKSLAEVMKVLVPDYDVSNINIQKLGRLNTSSPSKHSVLDDLTVKACDNINEICAPLMDEFFYSDDL
jgi:hypothetical protein